MEVHVPKKDLLRILACYEVADKKSAMPALANVLLTAANGQLHAVATDLYLTMSDSCAANVIAEGALALPAKDMYERVRVMPDGDVQMRLSGDLQIEMRSASMKRWFKVHGLPAADYPPIPKPDGIAWEIGADVFGAMMTAVHYAISADETRPQVNSAFLDWKHGPIVMVATDGHRLSKREGPRIDTPGGNMLIPLKAVITLRRICADAKKAILKVQVSGPCAFITLGTTVFSFKMIDAQFPPYDQVLPKQFNRTVRVERLALIDTLKAIQLAASDRTGGVKLLFGAAALTITAEGPECGSGGDEVPFDTVNGSPDANESPIGVNSQYLLQALGAVDTDTVDIGVNGGLEPMVVIADGFVGCVMPMRV